MASAEIDLSFSLEWKLEVSMIRLHVGVLRILSKDEPTLAWGFTCAQLNNHAVFGIAQVD